MKKFVISLLLLIIAGLSWFLYNQFGYLNELKANQEKIQSDLINVKQLFDENNENNDAYNPQKQSIVIESTNYYTINSDKSIIEFELISTVNPNYGFEIIKYDSDGNTIIIIPEYRIDYLPKESDINKAKITLEFNDNKEYSKLIVRVYDFNNGTFNQLLWDHAGDI